MTRQQDDRPEVLSLSGPIVNLTGVDITMASTSVSREMWSRFAALELTKSALVALQSTEAGLQGSEYVQGKMLIPDSDVAVDGEMVEVGALNYIFPLVKPKQNVAELIARWQCATRSYARELCLTLRPDMLAKTKRGGLNHYCLMRASAVCVEIHLGRATREELEHWMIPAQPVWDSEKQLIGYRSLIPANYLLPESASGDTAQKE